MSTRPEDPAGTTARISDDAAVPWSTPLLQIVHIRETRNDVGGNATDGTKYGPDDS